MLDWFMLGCILFPIVTLTMWVTLLSKRIANLEIIIAEKVIGSGLSSCCRRSGCQRSAGQAVESGVEAYRRGYRPF